MAEQMNHKNAKKIQLLLASKSPRRHDILQLWNIPFDCVGPSVNEVIPHDLLSPLKPPLIVQYLASIKNADVRREEYSNPTVIVSADTLVFSPENGPTPQQVFGRPASKDEARRMLQALKDHRHTVYTGVHISYLDSSASIKFKETYFQEKTIVTFSDFDDKTLEQYLDTEEYKDKAGAYALQGYAAQFISRVEGDYLNVVGFPLSRFIEELTNFLFELELCAKNRFSCRSLFLPSTTMN